MSDFAKNFTNELIDDAKNLAVVMKLSAFGMYSVFRVDEKKYFNKNTEKIVREKPVLVTNDDEIATAIDLLGGDDTGITSNISDDNGDGVSYSHYFIVEKQKPDWRAALALVEQIIGKAETKGKIEVSGSFSLLDLHTKKIDNE